MCRGSATPYAVADVEDHEAVVPVGEIREPVDDHDVVEIPSRLGLFRLPAGDLPGMQGILDVDHAHRARGVVGAVGVTSVDMRAVHAAGDRLRVLRNRLGNTWLARVR